MKDLILPHALHNAIQFQGKGNSKVVLGAVLKEHPQLKSDVPSLMKEIDAVFKDLSTLSIEQMQQKLNQLRPDLTKPTTCEIPQGPLKALPNACKGEVVVRIAPSPSGPLHIGHAYGTSLNYEYAKMYNGKLILRLEDTNAENIYPQAYELIERDARWMTDNGINEVVLQSSRLGMYYDNAEKLVMAGNAYVCTCSAEEWKELKNKAIPCPCRTISINENKLRFAKLFGEYAEGEAVVRIKTDIAHKNPAMRDFPIMRIVEHIHPKTGKSQRVWPLMIFSVAVDDHELGITHVLNGKDHTDNGEKERLIMQMLGWKTPEYKHWGMINFDGFTLSTTQTRQAIEQGKYNGWDDIRIPFLPALRRRGYQPGAFRKFAIEIGLSLNDKTVTMEEFWKMINSFNRDIIEPNANRYFFVHDPVKIELNGASHKKVSMALHDSFPDRGMRTLTSSSTVYLGRKDVDHLEEGKIHRLIDFCNIVMENGKYKVVSEKYEEFKNASNRGSIIHWLPVCSDLINVEVLLEDGSIIKGFGEPVLKNIKERDIVQFERFAFCTLDAKTSSTLVFWYLHK
ncbi:glutamate--tRNA ligase [Candidatus Woesearchaeota archaeon]|nr:glutamate--tRNA ligase [Candidatus Woesearchaeota archaeon]